jgi:flagellar M-ring protein FliF
LAELAKSAVGFDATRGDKFEISSAPFIRTPEPEPAGLGGLLADPKMKYAVFGGAGLLLLLIIGGVVMLARGGKKKALAVKDVTLIRPGARVAELEAALAAPQGALPPLEIPGGNAAASLTPAVDSDVVARERARTLAAADPQRAAQLLKAWMDADGDREVA